MVNAMTLDTPAPLILIVEDEPKLGQLMIDYLQAANFRTHHLLRLSLIHILTLPTKA